MLLWWNDLFLFRNKMISGLVLNLEAKKISAVVLDKDTDILPVTMY